VEISLHFELSVPSERHTPKARIPHDMMQTLEKVGEIPLAKTPGAHYVTHPSAVFP
jgi:hypothetical protein